MSCSGAPRSGWVVPSAVYQETFVDALDRGNPDAAAIEQAIKAVAAARPDDDPAAVLTGMHSVDRAVLEAGRVHGALLTNDLALGRRAKNLGVQWLRTADLVVLCVRAGTVGADQGRAALTALCSAGRMTEELLAAYLEELS